MLIWDGLFTNWKTGFVFDAQLHDLQFLVLELFPLSLYFSPLWGTDTVVFAKLIKPPVSIKPPSSNVFEYKNYFSHVQCSLFLFVLKGIQNVDRRLRCDRCFCIWSFRHAYKITGKASSVAVFRHQGCLPQTCVILWWPQLQQNLTSNLFCNQKVSPDFKLKKYFYQCIELFTMNA